MLTLPLVCSVVHPLCWVALHCACCRHHQCSRREGCSRSGRAVHQAACRYTAICTTISVALLHSDDNVSPQCCVQEGGLLLCFKQHWPDDILLVCLSCQSAGLQIFQHLANINLVGAHFCLPPCVPVAGGQQKLVDEVRSWNSSRTVEASKLSLSDLLVLRRLLRMYVVPEGAEVSAVLDPSACDSDFEW